MKRHRFNTFIASNSKRPKQETYMAYLWESLIGAVEL
jgi:hypothetical protein